MIYNHPVADSSLFACPGCDLLQRFPSLLLAASARCPRCNAELWRRKDDSLNRTLDLAVAVLVLYLAANSVPMLGLTVVGAKHPPQCWAARGIFRNNGQEIVGALVFFTAIAAPAWQILFTLAILFGARRSPVG